MEASRRVSYAAGVTYAVSTMRNCRRCDLTQAMCFRQCILCKLQQEKDVHKQSHLVLHISSVYQSFCMCMRLILKQAFCVLQCHTCQMYSSICKFPTIRPQGHVTNSEPPKHQCCMIMELATLALSKCTARAEVPVRLLHPVHCHHFLDGHSQVCSALCVSC